MNRMTILLIVLAFGFINCGTGYAQTGFSELKPEQYFDFWLGTWKLTWEDADGRMLKAFEHRDPPSERIGFIQI